MVKENLGVIAIVLALVAVFLVLTDSGEQEIVINENSETNTLAVSGRAELMVEPDKAEVFVRIETLEDTALEAQEENRRIANKVFEALKKKVKDEDIETTSYRLDRLEQWNGVTRKSEFKGYQLYHVLKITTTDLDEVGEIIDLSVEAEANGIDSVNFGLTDKTMSSARDQALEQAANEATKKAESLAGYLNVKLGKAKSIRETNYEYSPFVYSESRGMDMVFAEAAPTKVSPEKVEIRATVNVDFEIN